MTDSIHQELIHVGRCLFERGYAYGSAGNLSARDGDNIVASPTNCSLGMLDAASLSVIDAAGNLLCGSPPTKEINFHLAIYRRVPEAAAVVHLHSTYATAFSCLRDLPDRDPLPYFTPYFPMRTASLPVVAYHPPGSAELAAAVEAAAHEAPVLLLRNHGSIAWGPTLHAAWALAEELEEQCKLWFLLNGRSRELSPGDVAELHRRFGTRRPR